MKSGGAGSNGRLLYSTQRFATPATASAPAPLACAGREYLRLHSW